MILRILGIVGLMAVTLSPATASAADFDRFIGTYTGSAEFLDGETTQRRDMSATIAPTDKGFSVSWTSVTHKSDGRKKEKSYTVNFEPTQRDNIYGSAMKTNLFGKQTPLDPLKGEPFVWARFDGDTFTLFSLFINERGDYEMQEYHRTLADGGLDLFYRNMRAGAATREIQTFLKREN